MARYQEIADALRGRIQSGEFPVGAKLPGISALQTEYGVPGLNTIRAAQQLLAEEGMLETRQGVGAFVTSAESLKQVDVVDTLKSAAADLTKAISALEAPQRAVTIDLHAREETYFVLTDALGEWAARQRAEVEWEAANDNSTADDRWAAEADLLLEQIEAAL